MALPFQRLPFLYAIGLYQHFASGEALARIKFQCELFDISKNSETCETSIVAKKCKKEGKMWQCKLQLKHNEMFCSMIDFQTWSLKTLNLCNCLSFVCTLLVHIASVYIMNYKRSIKKAGNCNSNMIAKFASPTTISCEVIRDQNQKWLLSVIKDIILCWCDIQWVYEVKPHSSNLSAWRWSGVINFRQVFHELGFVM